jgi:hypothetical protein
VRPALNAFIQTTAQQSFQSNSKMYVLALSSCSLFPPRWLAWLSRRCSCITSLLYEADFSKGMLMSFSVWDKVKYEGNPCGEQGAPSFVL